MTFELKVYSRRDKKYLSYSIEKTGNGWNIKRLQLCFDNAVCDETGTPNLYIELNRDEIDYPKHLGNYMKYLWDQAIEEDMTDDRIQEHLNELGVWISIVEKESPKGTFWDGYK